MAGEDAVFRREEALLRKAGDESQVHGQIPVGGLAHVVAVRLGLEDMGGEEVGPNKKDRQKPQEGQEGAKVRRSSCMRFFLLQQAQDGERGHEHGTQDMAQRAETQDEGKQAGEPDAAEQAQRQSQPQAAGEGFG